MTQPDVLIRRLVAHGRVPAGSASGAALSRAMEGGLAGPLEQALAATGHQGYWLIRSLQVRACVGADWTVARMAEGVARSVRDAVERKARRGGDAAEMLWFPDRASFWAQYLLDLARGRTRGRWEYAGFDAARSWVDGASALLRRDGPGLVEALATLTPSELDELAGRVKADPLLESVTDGTRSVGPVLLALRLLREQGRLAVGDSTGLLLAVTAITAASAGAPRGPEGLKALSSVSRPALDVAALVRLVSAAGAGSVPLLTAVADGQWSQIARIAGADDFLGLVPWSTAERGTLVDTLTSRPVEVSGERWHTRFGGAFVLLPLLQQLWPWREATAAWPEPRGAPAERVAQLGVLAAAMGARGHDAALEDPALRTVLGIPTGVEAHGWLTGLDPAPFAEATGLDPGEEVDPWLATTPAFLGGAAAALLRELGRLLPGMASASPAYLWHNVLDLEAWVTCAPDDRAGLVELGHAPMGVLLAVSGLGRGELRVEGAEVSRWILTSCS